MDGEVEDADILVADIVPISGSRYTEGSPNQVEVEINDPPAAAPSSPWPGIRTRSWKGNPAASRSLAPVETRPPS